MVIKKGRISGVAKVGFVAQGPDIQIINANGKYMIPGLWDMHVHSAFVDPAWDEKVIYPLYIANGVTGVRDMGGDPEVLENRRNRIESGELLGPAPDSGRPVSGGREERPADHRREHSGRGAPGGGRGEKTGPGFRQDTFQVPRDSYFAIADESAKQKIPFVGHVPYSVSVREASTAGQRSIEHLTGVLLACSSREDELRAQGLAALAKRDYAAYEKLGPQIMSTYDQAKAGALFLQLAQNNTWQVPTLVWTQTNSRIDDPDLESDPRLQICSRLSARSVGSGEAPREDFARRSGGSEG